jgi:hypothetical protein
MQDLILVFLPREDKGGESNKEKERQQQENGSRDLVGTLVFYEFFGCHPGILIGFQFFVSCGYLTLPGLRAFCHGYKDSICYEPGSVRFDEAIL